MSDDDLAALERDVQPVMEAAHRFADSGASHIWTERRALQRAVMLAVARSRAEVLRELLSWGTGHKSKAAHRAERMLAAAEALVEEVKRLKDGA